MILHVSIVRWKPRTKLSEIMKMIYFAVVEVEVVVVVVVAMVVVCVCRTKK